MQVRADVFLLESGCGRKTAIHANVRSTSGILHVAVKIRLDYTPLPPYLAPANTTHSSLYEPHSAKKFSRGIATATECTGVSELQESPEPKDQATPKKN